VEPAFCKAASMGDRHLPNKQQKLLNNKTVKQNSKNSTFFKTN
jgi:hypothetical protein